MILVDMNQMTISHIMAESKGKPVFDPNLIRHMIINDLRLIRQRYHREYGELVLCYDSFGSWRASIFPEYKQRRKANRKESDFDWGALHTLMDEIRVDLKENFPYKIMWMPNFEADDVIATLAKTYSPKENVLILSSDEDFIQLQVFPNVKQYGFSQKKFLSSDNPTDFRIEHIIRGDAGDDIPNILSDNDVFVVEEKRQSPMTPKRFQSIRSNISSANDLYTDEGIDRLVEAILPIAPKARENFIRNRTLIDLVGPIPGDEKIIKEFESIVPAGRDKILNYLISKNMPLLVSHLTEF